MRHLVSLLLLTALGCGPKRGAVALPEPASAAVVSLLSPFDATTITPLPQRVNDRIDNILADRNLLVSRVHIGDAAQALTRRQTTEQRLRWLADQSASDYLVLVETTAVYNTQIEGRFRWSVEVVSTIAAQGDLPGASTRRFQVPVFLQFVHEKDEAAVKAAAVVIERQVSRQFDQWLSGQQADAPALPEPPTNAPFQQ